MLYRHTVRKREVPRDAVYEYGSEFDLARALGVTREQLRAWISGEEETSLFVCHRVADLLHSRNELQK
jgi:DNA-binding XRE family transcriptional regulator